MTRIAIFCTYWVFLCFFNTNAQEKTRKRKHEIGIDVANALTFIKKSDQSYLINYKYLTTRNLKIRAGLNLELSDEQSEGIYPDIRVGFQKERKDGKWSFLYGADGSFRYFKNNSLTSYQFRYGIAPLIGVQYYVHEKFSISTEGTLNLFFYQMRDPDSFDRSANQDYYSFGIGSIGMVFLYYHF